MRPSPKKMSTYDECISALKNVWKYDEHFDILSRGEYHDDFITIIIANVYHRDSNVDKTLVRLIRLFPQLVEKYGDVLLRFCLKNMYVRACVLLHKLGVLLNVHDVIPMIGPAGNSRSTGVDDDGNTCSLLDVIFKYYPECTKNRDIVVYMIHVLGISITAKYVDVVPYSVDICSNKIMHVSIEDMINHGLDISYDNYAVVRRYEEELSIEDMACLLDLVKGGTIKYHAMCLVGNVMCRETHALSELNLLDYRYYDHLDSDRFLACFSKREFMRKDGNELLVHLIHRGWQPPKKISSRDQH